MHEKFVSYVLLVLKFTIKDYLYLNERQIRLDNR